MLNISARDLALFISLLSSKIREMETALKVMESMDGEPDEEQVNERYELRECIEQYALVLGTLRPEYERGLEHVANLPGFDELTRGGERS